MKNILQIVGSFHQGGSEYQAIQLIRMLHEEGSYRVFVACLSGEGVLRGKVEEIGLTDIPAYPLNSFYDRNMLQQVARCARYIREKDISILQTHDFYTNVFGMAAGSLSRVPVKIAAKRETGMRSGSQQFVERRAFNLSQAVVANSEAVRGYLIGSGVDREKITTVYNGIDPRRVEPDETDRHRIIQDFGLPSERDSRFVTMVANLRSAVKNHRMFLRAAKRVKEALVGVNFIVAGEGELLNETKAFANELGLENHVFFVGRCERVGELLSISDVCALSSESEGFSNAILEYMAAAKPVVATAVGGAGEAIAENASGFLVQSDDDESMAARLTELLRDPARAAEMGRKGREIVEEKFSIHAQLEKSLMLYERLGRAGKAARAGAGF